MCGTVKKLLTKLKELRKTFFPTIDEQIDSAMDAIIADSTLVREVTFFDGSVGLLQNNGRLFKQIEGYYPWDEPIEWEGSPPRPSDPQSFSSGERSAQSDD